MKATLVRSLAALMLAASAGCEGGAYSIDHRVEDLVTIDHGLYGQVTAVNDVGNVEESYLPGFAIDAYEVPPGTELGAPVAITSSRLPRGFYEVALPAGDHVVCTRFLRCVLVTLAEGELRRLDYELGVGPGWSGGTPWPGPTP
jgi:hypothetical protein